ncbi:MAG: hypothetical protein GEU71_14910 [Actinobacteria bacterium]|nr:hypothetical protein [Actinomycetota bacterium]
MLDRGLRATFRNFSTLFFVVAIVLVPLNLVVTYVYRDAVRVREIETQIREFETEEILGVDADRLDEADRARTIVLLAELLLLSVFLGAARKVFDDDDAGLVPKASTALARGVVRPRLAPFLGAPGVTLSAAVLAGLVWLLLSRIGDIASEALYDEAAWAGVGLVRGLAFAISLPFLLGPVAYGSLGVKGVPPGEPTS